MATAALLGASLPLAVRVGRTWAEHRSSDLGVAIAGDVTAAFVIATGCLVIVSIVAGVRRAAAVVAAAFVLEGSLMLLVEHLDGFWFPLALDMVVGAVSWAAAGAIVAYHSRRSGRVDPPRTH